MFRVYLRARRVVNQVWYKDGKVLAPCCASKACQRWLYFLFIFLNWLLFMRNWYFKDFLIINTTELHTSQLSGTVGGSHGTLPIGLFT